MKNENETTSDNAAMPYDSVLATGLNNAATQIHTAARNKGFWDSERETGTLLMLCVSELSEALEADRKDRVSNLKGFNAMDWEGTDEDAREYKENYKIAFESCIKDTFEDELADTVIRILDLCGARGIDLERHIDLKLKYNLTRERMHGKNY